MTTPTRINVRVEVDISIEDAIEEGVLEQPDQQLTEGDLARILGGFEASASARIVEQERP